jgi:hypothetical protein
MNKSMVATQQVSSQSTLVEDRMTVLEIRPLALNGLYYQIIFKTSARIYQLSKDLNPNYLDLLKTSLTDGTSVLVTRKSEQSDTIISVRK